MKALTKWITLECAELWIRAWEDLDPEEAQHCTPILQKKPYLQIGLSCCIHQA